MSRVMCGGFVYTIWLSEVSCGHVAGVKQRKRRDRRVWAIACICVCVPIESICGIIVYYVN